MSSYILTLKTGRGDKVIKVNQSEFDIIKKSGKFNYTVKEEIQKPNVLKEKEPKEVKE